MVDSVRRADDAAETGRLVSTRSPAESQLPVAVTVLAVAQSGPAHVPSACSSFHVNQARALNALDHLTSSGENRTWGAHARIFSPRSSECGPALWLQTMGLSWFCLNPAEQHYVPHPLISGKPVAITTPVWPGSRTPARWANAGPNGLTRILLDARCRRGRGGI